MKHLIIYSHPNPKSFCHAILETVTEASKTKNHEIAVRDLYQINFDPVLKSQDFLDLKAGKVAPDIKIEQDYIRWADVMVMIYPVWWAGLPAILKGYVDRVYSSGFAYSFGKNGVVKLLLDKKVIIFNTQGASKSEYDSTTMFEAMKKISNIGIFDFCGIQVLEHKFFSSVPVVGDAVREGYLEEVKNIMSKF